MSVRLGPTSGSRDQRPASLELLLVAKAGGTPTPDDKTSWPDESTPGPGRPPDVPPSHRPQAARTSTFPTPTSTPSPIRHRRRRGAHAEDPGVIGTGSTPEGGLSALTGLVYVTNEGDDSISQYDIGTNGAVTPKTPATVATGIRPFTVAVSPDGDSAYVTAVEDDVVLQYDIGADGALTPKSSPTVSAGDAPVRLAVSPNGDSVYVTSNGISDTSPSTTRARTARSPRRLRPRSPPAMETSARSTWWSARRRLGLRQQPRSRHISQYDVGANGALTPRPIPPSRPTTVRCIWRSARTGAGPTCPTRRLHHLPVRRWSGRRAHPGEHADSRGLLGI